MEQLFSLEYMVSILLSGISLGGQLALIAIGRTANTSDAWWSDNGIEVSERGYVSTDALCRTSAEHVWAVGDITEGSALAHRAFAQGITVAEAVAGLNPPPVNDATVPKVVFSPPEAASIGLTLAEAKGDPSLHHVQETPFPMLSNARMLMSGSGGSLSLVSGEDDDHAGTPIVLGVHLVSPDAGDLIAEAQQLIGNRTPVHEAARFIHPHPTLSETFGETLLKADQRPLHTR